MPGFGQRFSLTNRPGFYRMRGFPKPSANREQIMYAVVNTGGKQYRVSAGENLRIEQVAAEVGQEIVLDEVLAVVDGDALKLGAPLLSGARVTAKVLAHGRGD